MRRPARAAVVTKTLRDRPPTKKQDLPVNPLALLARQKRHDARHIDRQAEPFQGPEIRHSPLNGLGGPRLIGTGHIMPGVGGKHIGLDASRRDGVDGNTLGPGVGGETTGEALDRGLGPGVDGVVGHAGHARRDRGHEDDAAAVREVAQGVLGDEELGARVEAEDAVVVVFRDVFFGAEDLHAGIGDDDVEPAEVRERLREELSDLRHFGDVGADGDGFAADRLDLRYDVVGGGRAVGVVDDDGGAALAEFEGDAGAETAAGAGYEDDFAVESGG